MILGMIKDSHVSFLSLDDFAEILAAWFYTIIYKKLTLSENLTCGTKEYINVIDVIFRSLKILSRNKEVMKS